MQKTKVIVTETQRGASHKTTIKKFNTEERSVSVGKFVRGIWWEAFGERHLGYKEPLTYGDIREDGRDEKIVMEESRAGLRV